MYEPPPDGSESRRLPRRSPSMIGAKEPILKSPRMISRAKTAPAIGVLKAAAIPPAAPHAARRRSRIVEAPRSCPNAEPRAAPICTIGPSRPTEPPVPIVRADAAVFTRATRGRIFPPFRAIDSMTSGTPCPRASAARKVTRGPTRSPPSVGIATTTQKGTEETTPVRDSSETGPYE